MQLLIIGDEDLFVEALGRFPSSSYSVVYAADTEEAEEQIESCPPRMIVVAGLPDDERLRALLDRARQRYGVVRIGVHRDQTANLDFAATFDHIIAEAEIPRALDKIELLAYTLPTRITEQGREGKTLEERVAEQARELKVLEKRVAEIALGTTGALSELLVAMDGVQQALKLHMRLIEGLDQGDSDAAQGEATSGIAMVQMRQAQRQLEERMSALSVQLAPFTTTGGETAGSDPRSPAIVTQQLETQVKHQSQDLKSLEQRITEVVTGTTGGLTELIEASDGVQQALKLHARLIGAADARIDNEVIPLRTSVVEMGNQMMALRRDVRALQRSSAAGLPGHLDEELASDLDLMLEPLDDDEPPSRPRPPAVGRKPAE